MTCSTAPSLIAFRVNIVKNAKKIGIKPNAAMIKRKHTIPYSMNTIPNGKNINANET